MALATLAPLAPLPAPAAQAAPAAEAGPVAQPASVGANPFRPAGPTGLRRAGELRVGADPSAGLPYFAPKAGGAYEGFEADLALALGQALRLKVSFVPTTWTDLPSALRAGRIDAAVNALEPKAVEGLAWTRPYYLAGQAILVRSQARLAPNHLRALAGRRIATAQGSTAERLLMGLRPRPMVLLAADVRGPFQALAANRAEAVLLEAAMVRHQAFKLPQAFKVASPTFLAKPYAVALREEDLALQAALDGAMEKLMGEGEHARILARYGLEEAAQAPLRRL